MILFFPHLCSIVLKWKRQRNKSHQNKWRRAMEAILCLDTCIGEKMWFFGIFKECCPCYNYVVLFSSRSVNVPTNRVIQRRHVLSCGLLLWETVLFSFTLFFFIPPKLIQWWGLFITFVFLLVFNSQVEDSMTLTIQKSPINMSVLPLQLWFNIIFEKIVKVLLLD